MLMISKDGNATLWMIAPNANIWLSGNHHGFVLCYKLWMNHQRLRQLFIAKSANTGAIKSSSGVSTLECAAFGRKLLKEKHIVIGGKRNEVD